MNEQITEFVASLKLKGRTLDVGSYDVNGNVRHLFKPGEYTGLDMRKGPNVDKVASAHKMPYPRDSFDNVLCLDMLEHDSEFWLSVSELRRVLRKGGRLVITVPGLGFPKHDHPSDFYRFTEEAVSLMFKDFKSKKVFAVGNYAWQPSGTILINGLAAVFAHGVK